MDINKSFRRAHQPGNDSVNRSDTKGHPKTKILLLDDEEFNLMVTKS